MQSLSVSLLAEEQDAHASPTPTAATSKCATGKQYASKCLDIVTYPLTKCLTLSCWSAQSYLQHDLTVLYQGVLQTVIGLICSDFADRVVDLLADKEHHHIIYFSLYVCMTYTICNIGVTVIQRSSTFNESISFHIGVLAHIVAFGMKDLLSRMFILIEYETSSVSMLVAYFFVVLLVSIIMIYAFDVIRSHFCFVVHAQFHDLSNTVLTKLSLSSLEEIDHHHSAHAFKHMLLEIDTDIFTVGISYVFVQFLSTMLVYGLVYVSYGSASVGGETDGDTDPDEQLIEMQNEEALPLTPGIVLLSMAASCLLCTPTLLMFFVLRWFITPMQMMRDRMAHKSFIAMNDAETKSEYVVCCAKCSYEAHKLSEQAVTFVFGFLGWSLGFLVVSMPLRLLFESAVQRLLFGLGVSVLVILIYWRRSFRLKRDFEAWRSRVDTLDLNVLSQKEHRKLYNITLTNHFVCKSFGLMIALPWEMTGESLLEHEEDDVAMAVFTILMALFVMIILWYTGSKLVRIEQESKQHSITFQAARFLHRNDQQLKEMKKKIVEDSSRYTIAWQKSENDTDADDSMHGH